MTEVAEPRHTESATLVVAKAAVLGVAAVVLLWNMAGATAIGAGLVAVALATVSARVADRMRLRVPVGALIGGALFGLAFLLSEWVLDATVVLDGLDSRSTLTLSDVLLFGLSIFGVVFAVRLAAARSRMASIIEAGLVVGAVAHLFARHRNLMINRPRFLTDWALANGLDPQVILLGIGVTAAAVAILMVLRRQRASKLLLSLVALLVLAVGAYWWVRDRRVEIDVETDLGLTKGEQDRANKGDEPGGEGDGDGSSKGDGEGDGSGSAPPPPAPVALAIFHDDYEPPNGVLYFRQQVQSKFDGTRLVTDSAHRFDTDVITQFPLDAPLAADDTQGESFHRRVPTSMFLMVDHPQPLALTASLEIAARENPAPRRFVATYTAISLAMETPFERLVGRPSVPAHWSPEKRAFYLGHADDPRYQALADQLVRELDPRFAGDDLMKALAIKRWLEVEGFYTRKERHANTPDPTADFLFGNLRGYCVHFAHAAANLFRSQGVAARVAVGYAVDNRMRGGGSAVLILGDRAHAWPEIHLEGVGWIPFDIYPERSDEPPPPFVDLSLESLLGELARGDPTGGLGDPDAEPFIVPWAAIFLGLGWILGGLLLLAYTVKTVRVLAPATGDHRRRFRATLDRFSDAGQPRRWGETRERYAVRLAPLAPSLIPLTRAHLRLTLGPAESEDTVAVDALSKVVVTEFGASRTGWQRLLGWLNPVGWWFTR